MANTECRHFTGYKPCKKSEVCDSSCRHQDVPRLSLLVIHLGALGAVVRSTSLLAGIKRKYPASRITWVTDAPAHHLLKGHPLIDQVLTSAESDLLELSALDFEVALVIDKSLKASGVLKRTHADQVFGFKVNPRNGAVLPATKAATELWELGLSDAKKFFENQKSENQLIFEALELGAFRRDEYSLPLNTLEEMASGQRRKLWLEIGKSFVIGLNTGCSDVIPYKKFSIEFHRRMIFEILKTWPEAQVVLLGGPEDEKRNALISEGLPVKSSSTNLGLRDGLVSVAACDLVITGDSLGMHMAISQKKQVIAWFGPTCSQEIDLYDRGVKIQSQSPCAPCWKRTCEKEIMCYDQVSISEMMNAIKSCRTNSLSGGFTSGHSLVEAL